MKTFFKILVAAVFMFGSSVLFSFNTNDSAGSLFPYKQAGLTERQAAAHLISRFTFGAQPGQVDEVVKIGLENWFDQQLTSNLPNEDLEKKLANFEALKMNNSQIVATYIQPAQVLKMALTDGTINKDSVAKIDKEVYKKVLTEYITKNGMKPQAELFRQLANQKILRAAYSNNQLEEILTDFWFNHFNVSITKKDCAEFILGFEKDVIRPNVLGSFSDLLLATAKSPAMLYYLDNFSSAAADGDNIMNNRATMARVKRKLENEGSDTPVQDIEHVKIRKKVQGLNENYAREIMELHTLGVEGGYTQNDVSQAAKILTGWTVYPMGNYGMGNAIKNLIDKIGEDKLAERGFLHEGDFLFAANRHDRSEKIVLGKTFAPTGYQEGIELLKMLAHHTSTAKFISRKIAVRFVSDEPPASLISRMANTFTDTRGDIKKMLQTMVHSPEFWNKNALREKTKSPFELVMSSVRSLQAEIRQPYQLYNWVDKMGQKLYYYQAPTGFPDKGQYWINTGALLSRMNFGLALAAGKIPGITFSILQLNQGHEPESAEDALRTYGKIMLPERDLSTSLHTLTPFLNEPELRLKIEKKVVKQLVPADTEMLPEANEPSAKENALVKSQLKRFASNNTKKESANMLSHVVGIIIGSPEFQRR